MAQKQAGAQNEWKDVVNNQERCKRKTKGTRSGMQRERGILQCRSIKAETKEATTGAQHESNRVAADAQRKRLGLKQIP